MWLEDYAAVGGRRARTASRRTGSPAGSGSTTCRSAYPGTRPARPRRRQPATSRRAPWSRSWARTAPARRRWSSCWPGCTTRTRAGSTSTAPTCVDVRAERGGSGWPARSRTSSGSSSSAIDSVGARRPRPARRAAGGHRRRRPRRRRPTSSSTLPQGLDTQLGPTWDSGVEVSFGQWQKLALARGFMRDEPLLLVLDEPTAALDAETEHALFERFADAARQQAGNGPGHGPGVAPVLDGADGRPHRRPRRCPGASRSAATTS